MLTSDYAVQERLGQQQYQGLGELPGREGRLLSKIRLDASLRGTACVQAKAMLLRHDVL